LASPTEAGAVHTLSQPALNVDAAGASQSGGTAMHFSAHCGSWMNRVVRLRSRVTIVRVAR
jgi:hypothetical protein